MRKTLLLSACIIAVIGCVLAGCTNDNTTTPNPPTQVTATLALESNSVEVAAVGGSYTLNYAIVDGYDGITLRVVSNASWVSDISCTATTITFTVATNNASEPRSATLTTKYPGIEDKTINITQLGNENFFDISISKETSTSCQSTVVAKNPEMAYIVYMAELDYFFTKCITSAEELFTDDYIYFQGLAEEYNSNLGQFMMINEMAFYGQSDIVWTGMTPNKDYVLYAYGIEFNDSMTEYTLATPISYMMVKLESGALRDIEFDVKVTVNGPEVFYEFEPVNWNGKYYIEIFSETDFFYIPEGEGANDVYCETLVNNWLAMMSQYMSSGYSGEQLMKLMCLEGKDSYGEVRLADTKYMMSFYAIDLIDGIPQVVSRPYLVYFKTEPVMASDMTIDIKVENVYTRVADVSITPSKDNEPYALALLLTDDIPEGSNEDIIGWLTGSYGMSVFKGTVTSHLNSLDPETEYSLLAFGYHGGVVTTDLYRLDFKTEPVSECENSVVRVDFMGPYSPTDLAKHFPDALNGMESMYEQYGFYVMWAEIITEKPSNDVFIFHYEPSEFAGGDAYVFNDLVNYPSDRVTVLTARSGVEFIMCGVTMDYRGNYSDMWKSEPFTYTYDKSTKRPIEELVEKFNSPSPNGRLMVVAPDARNSATTPAISLLKK